MGSVREELYQRFLARTALYVVPSTVMGTLENWVLFGFWCVKGRGKGSLSLVFCLLIQDGFAVPKRSFQIVIYICMLEFRGEIGARIVN